MYTEFWYRKQKERDHSEHPSLDGRTLQRILQKSVARARSGLIWLRTGTIGGLL